MKAGMQCVRAEWQRLVRQRSNLWVLAVFALLLGASAVWSGIAAREHRAAAAAQHERWEQRRLAAQAQAGASRDAAKAMMAAFQFARGDAPPAVLPALGGLALGTGGFALLAPDARVSIESRHTDARQAERLGNPLLEGFGLPDFSTVLALLLPLAILALGHGLVQEQREHGQWRLAVAQCARPGRVLAVALALRGAVAWCVAAAASSLAFALDPGATAEALLGWLAAVAVFCACWTALAGLFNLLPLSSGSTALGLLACWLLSTFAVPAALAAWADREAPMPSRLAAIAAVRHAQQDAEVHMERHLADWYAAHPEALPPGRASHTWPVSFLPRYLAQERMVRPLMLHFDAVRARRFAWLADRSWLSPSLALAMLADRLAGIDAPRHLQHVERVNAYEDAWRGFFVPRIMAYRGLAAGDFDRLPRFEPLANGRPAGMYRPTLWLGLLALALCGCIALARRSLEKP
jgi:ABC-2 type transport system permease protein